MKSPLVQVSVLLGCAFLASRSAAPVLAQAAAPEKEKRWDIQALKHVSQWRDLLQDPHIAAQAARPAWREKKEALQALLERHPKSDYADDVEVAIACGVAACEGDLRAAERSLRRIIKEYPDAKSVMAWWRPGQQYSLDPSWYMWASQVVRAGRRRREPSASERAALAYFAHLDKYPNYTRDVAAYYLTTIRKAMGAEARSVQDLRTLVDSTRGTMVEFKKADRQAAARPDGGLIREVQRAPIWATYDLISLLDAERKTEEAIGAAETFVHSLSGDGWYWLLNVRLGDLYHRKAGGKRSPDAEKQFRLALQGYVERAKGISLLGDNRFQTPESHAAQIRRLKEKIRSAGGEIEVDAKEIESWRSEARPPRPPVARQADAGKERPTRAGEAVESLERRLRAMPARAAHAYCLSALQKVANDPDRDPKLIILLMRGLPENEDPPEVAVLRKILRKSHDRAVREECVRSLAEWIADPSEVRDDVLRILGGLLSDPTPRMRARAAYALGKSADLRCMRKLYALLDDPSPQVRGTAAVAIGRLLGWGGPDLRAAGTDDRARDELKRRLGPVLDALGALRKATEGHARSTGR